MTEDYTIPSDIPAEEQTGSAPAAYSRPLTTTLTTPAEEQQAEPNDNLERYNQIVSFLGKGAKLSAKKTAEELTQSDLDAANTAYLEKINSHMESIGAEPFPDLGSVDFDAIRKKEEEYNVKNANENLKKVKSKYPSLSNIPEFTSLEDIKKRSSEINTKKQSLESQEAVSAWNKQAKEMNEKFGVSVPTIKSASELSSAKKKLKNIVDTYDKAAPVKLMESPVSPMSTQPGGVRGDIPAQNLATQPSVQNLQKKKEELKKESEGMYRQYKADMAFMPKMAELGISPQSLELITGKTTGHPISYAITKPGETQKEAYYGAAADHVGTDISRIDKEIKSIYDNIQSGMISGVPVDESKKAELLSKWGELTRARGILTDRQHDFSVSLHNERSERGSTLGAAGYMLAETAVEVSEALFRIPIGVAAAGADLAGYPDAFKEVNKKITDLGDKAMKGAEYFFGQTKENVEEKHPFAGFVGGMAPYMVPGAPGAAMMFATSFSSNYEKYKNLPPANAFIVNAIESAATSYIMSKGLDVTKGHGAINSIILGAIESVPKPVKLAALYPAIDKAISVAEKGVSAALSGGAAFAALAPASITSSALIENINNLVSSNQIDAPNIIETVSNIIESVPREFNNGAGLAVIMAPVNGYMTGRMNMDTFKDAVYLRDQRVMSANINKIKQAVADGTIKKDVGNTYIKNLIELRKKISQIPDNLSLNDQYNAWKIITENDRLSQEASGLSDAFKKPILDKVEKNNKKLQEIAMRHDQVYQHEKEGGSTFVRGRNQLGEKVSSVSIFPERTVKIEGPVTQEDIDNFKEANKDLLEGNEDILSVGTWKDKDGKTHIDISAITPHAEAEALGRMYNQKAVFNLEKNKEVSTGGTGEPMEGMNSEADRVKDIRELVGRTKATEADFKPIGVEEVASRLGEGSRVVKAVRNAMSAVSGLSDKNNVSIRFHDTNASMQHALNIGNASNRDAKITKANFAYVKNDKGGWDMTIDVNLKSRADEATIRHEFTHGILLHAFGEDPAMFQKMKDAFRSYGNMFNDSNLVKFADMYDKSATAEEYLAELSAISKNIKPGVLSRIAEFINNVAAKYLGDKFVPFKDVNDANDIIRYFGSLSNAVRTGKPVEIREMKEQAPVEGESKAKSKQQAEELFKEDRKEKFKSLSEVASFLEEWGKENKLFDKSIEDVSDEEVVEKLADHIYKEIQAWDSVKGSEYIGFYDEDIPVRLNPELQKFSEKVYGRKLEPHEVSLYHIVSAFASPSADPVFDSSKGLEVFDKYMTTGEISAYSKEQATEWEKNEKGEKYDTGKLKFDKEGNPVYKQVAPYYASDSMVKLNKVIEHFDGNLKKAIDWLESIHTYEEISEVLGTPTKGSKSISENEYLTKKNGGFGVFGITGVKLGSYILNRIGNYSTVTKDMWYARTLARLAGEPLTEKGKAIKSPWGLTKAGLRKRILADKAFDIVAKKLGTTPADVQQKAWDFEKRLYEKLGSKEKAGYASEGFKKKSEQILKEREAKSKQQLVTDKKMIKKMTEDEDGNYLFYHYSPNKIAGKIDPRFFGRNPKTGRDERPGIGISMYYTRPDYRDVGGNYGYVVRVPKDKVYPFNEDPLNLYDKAEATFQKMYPGQAFDPNKQVAFIAQEAAKLGYDMTVAKWGDQLRAQTTKPMKGEWYEKPHPEYRYSPVYNPKLEGFQANEKKPKSKQRLDEWEESRIGKGDRAITDRNENVKNAAEEYYQGNIDIEEYNKIVDKNSEISPITSFIKPAKEEDIIKAVGEKSKSKVNLDFEAGKRVGLRLDIPAYTRHNIWAITVHENGKQGIPLSYNNVARIKNVEFVSDPTIALDIARHKLLSSGERMNKTTIARMMGDWVPIEGETSEDKGVWAMNMVDEIKNNPEWSQIGMNPFRHSYFYDRATKKPVIAAEEVIQIGGLVYAKNVKTTSIHDERFTVYTDKQRTVPLIGKGGVKSKFRLSFGDNVNIEGVNVNIPKEKEQDILKADRSTKKYFDDKVKGMKPSGLSKDELKKLLDSDNMAILTGTNPDGNAVDDKTNDSLNKKAEEWLKENNYKYHEVTGKYGQTESSFIVEGMTAAEAMDFAERFKQDSVAHSEGLVYRRGAINRRDNSGDEFGVDVTGPEEDFVSAIKTKDGEVVGFKIGYDFDKEEEYNPEPKSKQRLDDTGMKFKDEMQKEFDRIKDTDEKGRLIEKAISKASGSWAKWIRDNQDQYDEAVRQFKKDNGIKVKSAPSHETIFGEKPSKMEVDNKGSLKAQIKLEMMAAMGGRVATEDFMKSVAKGVNSMAVDGVITPDQATRIIKRMANLDQNNPEALDKFYKWVDEMFEGAKQNQEKIEGRAETKGQMSVKNFMRSVADRVKSMAKRGVITANQASAITKRMAFLNPKNAESVNKFYDWVDKIFSNAEYADKLKEASTNRNKIKGKLNSKEIPPELAKIAKRFSKIDPSEVSDIDEYNKMSKMLWEGLRPNVMKRDKYGNIVESKREAVNMKDMNRYIESQEDAMQKKKEKAEKAAEEDPEIIQNLQDSIDQLSDIARSILETGINPIDGTSVDLTSKEKSILKKFLDMKPKEKKTLMDTEYALKHFIENGDTGLMEYARERYDIDRKVEAGINALKRATGLGIKRLPVEWVVSAVRSLKNIIPTKYEESMRDYQYLTNSSISRIDTLLRNIEKGSPVFKTLFRDIAAGYSFYRNKTKEMNSEKIYQKMLKGLNGDIKKAAIAKYKITMYLRQLEHESNPGSSKSLPAMDYMKATIEAAKLGTNKMSKYSRKVLEKLIQEYSYTDADGVQHIDKDKIYDSLSEPEKNAVSEIQKLYKDLLPFAKTVAEKIRNNPFDEISNYVSIAVNDSSLSAADINTLATEMQAYLPSSLSTKAGQIEDRTGVARSIDMDPFSTVNKAVRNILLDHSMTSNIMALRRITKNFREESVNGDDDVRLFAIALDNVSNEVIKSVVGRSYTERTTLSEAMDLLTRKSVTYMLAGLEKITKETGSNIAFVSAFAPAEFANGAKYMKYITSGLGGKILEVVNSYNQDRLYPHGGDVGKVADTESYDISVSSSQNIPSDAQMIAFKAYYNTLNRAIKVGRATSEGMLSGPDIAMARPLWFGSMAMEFKRITGKEIDFDKIANSDAEYLESNMSAIEQARDVADKNVVDAASTKNPFLRPPKLTMGSRNTQLWSQLNNFLSGFGRKESEILIDSIDALYREGQITKTQAVKTIAAVTARAATYRIIGKVMAGILSTAGVYLSTLMNDDEDDKLEAAIRKKISKNPSKMEMEAAQVEKGYFTEYSPKIEGIDTSINVTNRFMTSDEEAVAKMDKRLRPKRTLLEEGLHGAAAGIAQLLLNRNFGNLQNSLITAPLFEEYINSKFINNKDYNKYEDQYLVSGLPSSKQDLGTELLSKTTGPFGLPISGGIELVKEFQEMSSITNQLENVNNKLKDIDAGIPVKEFGSKDKGKLDSDKKKLEERYEKSKRIVATKIAIGTIASLSSVPALKDIIKVVKKASEDVIIKTTDWDKLVKWYEEAQKQAKGSTIPAGVTPAFNRQPQQSQYFKMTSKGYKLGPKGWYK